MQSTRRSTNDHEAAVRMENLREFLSAFHLIANAKIDLTHRSVRRTQYVNLPADTTHVAEYVFGSHQLNRQPTDSCHRTDLIGKFLFQLFQSLTATSQTIDFRLQECVLNIVLRNGFEF